MTDHRPWVIMCSARPWAAGRHRCRALAGELAGAYRVLFVDPPTNRRRRSFGVQALADDLWWARLAAPVPGSRGFAGVNRLTRQRAVFDLDRWLADRPGTRALWISDVRAEPMIGELSETAVIYDAADLDWAAPVRGPEDAARRRVLAAAEVVLTNSVALGRRLPGLRRPARPVTDGCDTAPFVRPVPSPGWLARLPHPRLGYVGPVDQRTLDVEMVEQVVRAAPHWRFVFAGRSEPKVARRLRRYPNVLLPGPVAESELPALLGGLDVGLLPHRADGPAGHVHPSMILSYLAAGLPVVASPLPALRPGIAPVRLAGDATVFVDAVARALTETDDPFAQVRRRRYAARQSWASRGATVRDLLADLVEPAAVRRVAA